MSVFDTNIIEDSSDWAVEQIFNFSEHPCTVCKQPMAIWRKDNGEEYYTVYTLFNIYRHSCTHIELIESKIFHETRQHSRKVFIQFVRDNCVDKVLYKHNYYYSKKWFNNEFIKDIHKHYFDI